MEEELSFLKGHSTPSINDRVRSLTDSLLSCYRDACPFTYPGMTSQPAWWNGELQRLRCCTRRLFYKAKMAGKDVHWSEYRSSFNDYKSVINRSHLDKCLRQYRGCCQSGSLASSKRSMARGQFREKKP